MIGFHQNKNFSQNDINFVKNKINEFTLKRNKKVENEFDNDSSDFEDSGESVDNK